MDYLQEAKQQVQVVAENTVYTSNTATNLAKLYALIAIGQELKRYNDRVEQSNIDVLGPSPCWCDGAGKPGLNHSAGCPQFRFGEIE